MDSSGPSIHFLNLEYFFRLLYDLIFRAGGSASGTSGAASGAADFSSVLAFMSNVWLAVTVLAYLFTLAAIGVLVYYTMRLYQIRHEEEEAYSTVHPEASHDAVEHSRWVYIQGLIESGQESDWRQAIIESDIILDELLTRLGYQGNSIGEKLRAVNPNHFQTLQQAWEAHKVRNEIAHQGMNFQLSEHLAHRTIANYEAVFREHGEV